MQQYEDIYLNIPDADLYEESDGPGNLQEEYQTRCCSEIESQKFYIQRAEGKMHGVLLWSKPYDVTRVT